MININEVVLISKNIGLINTIHFQNYINIQLNNHSQIKAKIIETNLKYNLTLINLPMENNFFNIKYPEIGLANTKNHQLLILDKMYYQCPNLINNSEFVFQQCNLIGIIINNFVVPIHYILNINMFDLTMHTPMQVEAPMNVDSPMDVDSPMHALMKVEAPMDTKLNKDQLINAVKLKQEFLKLTEKYLRLAAEFTNFKYQKNIEKKAHQFEQKVLVVKEILDVIDNFERAIFLNIYDQDTFNKIYQQLIKIVNKIGVESIECIGKPFDISIHKAIRHQESTFPANYNIKEFSKGYKLNNYLLRPSLVLVSK